MRKNTHKFCNFNWIYISDSMYCFSLTWDLTCLLNINWKHNTYIIHNNIVFLHLINWLIIEKELFCIVFNICSYLYCQLYQDAQATLSFLQLMVLSVSLISMLVDCKITVTFGQDSNPWPPTPGTDTIPLSHWGRPCVCLGIRYNLHIIITFTLSCQSIESLEIRLSLANWTFASNNPIVVGI